MRRAVLTLAVGGVLLAGAAACGTASPSANGPAGTGQSVNPAVQASLADTRTVCEALGQAYGRDIGPFASALNTMVAARKSADGGKASQAQAQQSLSALAKAVLGATQGSSNAQVRVDGLTAAKQLDSQSANAAFFTKIQTAKDMNTVLGPTLKQWLAPISQHCS